MGAGQSSVAANGHIKESLYDVLQVPSDADATVLKKAYRQRALELHPDRNFNNEEEATAKFSRVQTAYDILNDPKEREWYDNHRKSSAYDTYDGGITTATDVRATVVRELRPQPSKSPFDFDRVAAHFEKLKHEEQEAAFEQGINPPPVVSDAPPFGTRSDSWADAQRFYNVWSSFATVKSYAWEDIYPSHLATDRKTRRKFDQHNKRVRDAGKREFNAAVRYAVSMLRQADPRRPAEPVRQSKPANPPPKPAKTTEVGEFREQEWQQAQDVTPGGDGEVFECIVCDEQFETLYDQQDHEKSTTHRRALEAMRAQLLMDEQILSGTAENSGKAPDSDGIATRLENLSTKDEDDSSTKKPGKAKAKAKRKQKGNKGILLTCGTCGEEFAGDELMQHKKITRHP